jgi:hypothetical protein
MNSSLVDGELQLHQTCHSEVSAQSNRGLGERRIHGFGDCPRTDTHWLWPRVDGALLRMGDDVPIVIDHGNISHQPSLDVRLHHCLSTGVLDDAQQAIDL